MVKQRKKSNKKRCNGKGFKANEGTTNIRAKMHSKRISSLDTAFRQKGQPQYLVVGLFLNYYGLIADTTRPLKLHIRWRYLYNLQ
jgi:hypothetical protein